MSGPSKVQVFTCNSGIEYGKMISSPAITELFPELAIVYGNQTNISPSHALLTVLRLLEGRKTLTPPHKLSDVEKFEKKNRWM
jgi:hypothetical protein